MKEQLNVPNIMYTLINKQVMKHSTSIFISLLMSASVCTIGVVMVILELQTEPSTFITSTIMTPTAHIDIVYDRDIHPLRIPIDIRNIKITTFNVSHTPRLGKRTSWRTIGNIIGSIIGAFFTIIAIILGATGRLVSTLTYAMQFVLTILQALISIVPSIARIGIQLVTLIGKTIASIVVLVSTSFGISDTSSMKPNKVDRKVEDEKSEPEKSKQEEAPLKQRIDRDGAESVTLSEHERLGNGDEKSSTPLLPFVGTHAEGLPPFLVNPAIGGNTTYGTEQALVVRNQSRVATSRSVTDPLLGTILLIVIVLNRIGRLVTGG